MVMRAQKERSTAPATGAHRSGTLSDADRDLLDLCAVAIDQGADSTIFSTEAGTQAQSAVTPTVRCATSGCRRSRPDVVRHNRGSGAVLSYQPSTAPARAGNVIANTAITITRTAWPHPGDRR